MVTTWDNLLGDYSPISSALQIDGSPITRLWNGGWLQLLSVDFAKNSFHVFLTALENFAMILIPLAFLMVIFNIFWPMLKALGRWRL